MSGPKDGGPAFPAQPTFRMPAGTISVESHNGMTLRDYFAAKALQGYLAGHGNILASAETVGECQEQFTNAAAFAYRMADEMLAERSKP